MAQTGFGMSAAGTQTYQILGNRPDRSSNIRPEIVKVLSDEAIAAREAKQQVARAYHHKVAKAKTQLYPANTDVYAPITTGDVAAYLRSWRQFGNTLRKFFGDRASDVFNTIKAGGRIETGVPGYDAPYGALLYFVPDNKAQAPSMYASAGQEGKYHLARLMYVNIRPWALAMPLPGWKLNYGLVTNSPNAVDNLVGTALWGPASLSDIAVDSKAPTAFETRFLEAISGAINAARARKASARGGWDLVRVIRAMHSSVKGTIKTYYESKKHGEVHGKTKAEHKALSLEETLSEFLKHQFLVGVPTDSNKTYALNASYDKQTGALRLKSVMVPWSTLVANWGERNPQFTQSSAFPMLGSSLVQNGHRIRVPLITRSTRATNEQRTAAYRDALTLIRGGLISKGFTDGDLNNALAERTSAQIVGGGVVTGGSTGHQGFGGAGTSYSAPMMAAPAMPAVPTSSGLSTNAQFGFQPATVAPVSGGFVGVPAPTASFAPAATAGGFVPSAVPGSGGGIPSFGAPAAAVPAPSFQAPAPVPGSGGFGANPFSGVGNAVPAPTTAPAFGTFGNPAPNAFGNQQPNAFGNQQPNAFGNQQPNAFGNQQPNTSSTGAGNPVNVTNIL